MFKIDKGVPVPRKETTYPFPRMEVGDSFFIPGGTNASRSGVYNCAKNLGMKAKLRQTTEDGVDGVRVWRIE